MLMAEEKYLCLYPDGSMKWIHTHYDRLLDDFRAAIGCERLKNVDLFYGFSSVVDECGKFEADPQSVNYLASALYPGTFSGDPFVGPVIFVSIGLRDGESDLVPLRPDQLAKLELLFGVHFPDC